MKIYLIPKKYSKYPNQPDQTQSVPSIAVCYISVARVRKSKDGQRKGTASEWRNLRVHVVPEQAVRVALFIWRVFVIKIMLCMFSSTG